MIYYEDIPIFNNLPVGLDDQRLQTIIAEFRQSIFDHREEFIKAHTRLATSVALRYGYRNNRGDDLVGVALIELCKFPEIIAEGALRNDKDTIRYLLSRLHFACREHIDIDRIFGPSRGHLDDHPDKVVRRESMSCESVTLTTVYDKQHDLELDLCSLIQTNKEELILKRILNNETDREIATEFGWLSPTTVNHGLSELVKRYRCSILDDVKVHLPYPDYKESLRVLHDRHLVKQQKCIYQILNGNWSNHPASIMWRGYRWQLANYGLYTADELRRRNLYNVDHFDWFLHRRETYPDNVSHDMPSWFDNNRLHASHRCYLLSKDNSYYSQYCWGLEPHVPYYWPVKGYC